MPLERYVALVVALTRRPGDTPSIVRSFGFSSAEENTRLVAVMRAALTQNARERELLLGRATAA